MSQNFKPNIDHYAISADWLMGRMLFIAGPRQVGKTTYAQKKISELGGNYFNWDDRAVRDAYKREAGFFVETSEPGSLVVFDEIHKRRKWKDILKGIYDVHKQNYQFMVTGSAKLDTFRRSGDSLVGRYFLTHIFPLSIGDLLNLDFQEYTDAEILLQDVSEASKKISQDYLDDLLELGGFPEPFFSASQSTWRRWQKQHQELLIREDLKDLSNIQNLDAVENLVNLLEPRVAGPVSYNSLAEDLEVDHKSVKQWILQLEKIMLCFKVPAWSKQIQKSMRKNSKLYFYDWSYVKDPGARFENFVASQLLKATTLWNDRFGYDFELYFIRTYKQEEIDFCITLNSKPWLLVEAKAGDPEPSSALYKFSQELKIPAVVLTAKPNWSAEKNKVKIFDAKRFFAWLP